MAEVSIICQDLTAITMEEGTSLLRWLKQVRGQDRIEGDILAEIERPTKATIGIRIF